MTAEAKLTASELAAFRDQALHAHEAAVRRLGQSVVPCAIAGVHFTLDYAGTALRDAFQPALAGIADASGRPPVGRILVFDNSESGVPRPEFSRPVQHLIRWRGDCWQEPDARCQLAFHMSDFTLQIYDPDAGLCVVMVNDLARLPAWSLAAPLRLALGLTLQSHGVQFVHGAAVGDREGAVLVTGYGGSGKSTTALACQRAGLGILGDDYVAVRPARAPGEAPSVHNIYSTFKIVPSELNDEPFHARDGGKAILLPFAGDAAARLRQAPLRALFCTGFGTGAESAITPVHPDMVERVAAASTALQITGDDALARDLIAACIRQAGGTFRLRLGSDRDGVAQAIARFLREPAAMPDPPPPPVWASPAAAEPISVVIPVHNGAAFIAEAVESIALQDHPVHEIIIVDDGSTDALDAALARITHPFRLIRRAQGGPAAARNTGLEAATGTWIAFLDADDLWPPGRLSQLVRDLILHEDAGVVHGKAITIRTDPDTGLRVQALHARENYNFYIGSGLYRRSTFARVGAFDATLTYGEDMDWYWRAHEAVRVITIPDIVLHVRMHETNMTADLRKTHLGAASALKRFLDRRRAGQAAKE